jgi:hypothetical protein
MGDAELKCFWMDMDAEGCGGTQTLQVMALDLARAKEKFGAGLGEMVSDDSEISKVSKNYDEIYEVEDASPTLMEVFENDWNEINQLRTELEQVKKELPSIERGANRYGVDVAYFRKTINRELNRSLRDFRPSELARVFARLSRTADEKVMHEPEFALSAEAEEGESQLDK